MVKERQGERSKDLKVFQQMVCAHLQITRTAVSSDQRGCASAVEKGLGVYHARTMESNKERLESHQAQRLKQVRIRTSPDASPENVDVFVGSDSTDSVTAPCLETSEPLGTGVDTHTHTHWARFFRGTLARPQIFGFRAFCCAQGGGDASL